MVINLKACVFKRGAWENCVVIACVVLRECHSENVTGTGKRERESAMHRKLCKTALGNLASLILPSEHLGMLKIHSKPSKIVLHNYGYRDTLF